MKNQPMNRTRILSLVVFLPGIVVLFHAQPAAAIGPNIMMSNSSFEGLYYYNLPAGGPFAIVKDPANARTGVRSLQVKIQPTGSCTTKYPLFVWPNTSYTTSVWYKGHGTLQLQVLKHDGSLELAHVNFTAAGDTWKQASVTYKTRNFYAIKVAINEVGGAGSVVYLDDLYTGLTDGQTIDFDPKKLDPKKPAANGFKLLWADEFDDINTIDVKTTKGDGYKWYTHRFYGFPNTTPNMYSMKGGVLTLTDCPTPLVKPSLRRPRSTTRRALWAPCSEPTPRCTSSPASGSTTGRRPEAPSAACPSGPATWPCRSASISKCGGTPITTRWSKMTLWKWPIPGAMTVRCPAVLVIGAMLVLSATHV